MPNAPNGGIVRPGLLRFSYRSCSSLPRTSCGPADSSASVTALIAIPPGSSAGSIHLRRMRNTRSVPDSPEAVAERKRLREINEYAARYAAAVARGESPPPVETPEAKAAANAARLYEETTPGFLMPPQNARTDEYRIGPESYGPMYGPTVEELCMALERLVPDRCRRFLLKPRIGLFSRAVYQLG